MYHSFALGALNVKLNFHYHSPFAVGVLWYWVSGEEGEEEREEEREEMGRR